jgi:hypothetical protein
MSNMPTTEEIYAKRMWELFHSCAAYYPAKPTEADREHAEDFFGGFIREGLEYPHLGEHFELD